MEMTLEMSCLASRGLEETHNIIGVNHIENENLDIQPTSPDIQSVVPVAVGRKRNWENSTLADLEETLVDQTAEDMESKTRVNASLFYL